MVVPQGQPERMRQLSRAAGAKRLTGHVVAGCPSTMADMTTDINTTDDKMNTFTLDDIKVGSTVMAGRSTSNRRAQGTVTEVIPGVCIHVDNGVQPSVLWGDFEIIGSHTVDPASSAATAEEGELPPGRGPALRRTDSGADYGMPGYPDCEFWEAHGAQPVFVATASQYSRDLTTRTGFVRGGPREILDLLEEAGEPPSGSAALRAWWRQKDLVAPIVTPPPSPRATSPACPGAPARPVAMRPPLADHVRPMPLVIPTLEDHRGRGILAGDWIKPDPVMTRQETRRYVVAETERWLTGRICRHAQDLETVDDLPHATLEAEVATGRWPAARLYLVADALEGTDIIPLPVDPAERYHAVGSWAAKVCEDHLRGYAAEVPAAKLAVGFVTTDLLPCGPSKVIASFWDHSPFEALRNAPPLADTDTEDAVPTQSDEEAEEDVAGPMLVRPSMDEHLDEIGQAAGRLMHTPIRLTLLGWQWLAVVGAVLAYVWTVAFLIGGRR